MDSCPIIIGFPTERRSAEAPFDLSESGKRTEEPTMNCLLNQILSVTGTQVLLWLPGATFILIGRARPPPLVAADPSWLALRVAKGPGCVPTAPMFAWTLGTKFH